MPKRIKPVRLRGPQPYIKYTEYTTYTKTAFIHKSKMKICVGMFRNVELVKTCFLFFVMQVKGWGGPYRIEETKLVCAISRQLFWG